MLLLYTIVHTVIKLGMIATINLGQATKAEGEAESEACEALPRDYRP